MMGEGIGMPAGGGYPVVIVITGGPGMTGPRMGMMGSGGGGVMSPDTGMMGGEMMQMMHGMMHRDKVLEQRLDRLEDLMQQLIDHEGAEEE